MTYEVQQNRWDNLIRRASGSIGPGSRVSETISELFPMFDVENLPAELLFLSGSRIGMGAATLGANVGDIPKIQLFNPADSGHIVTLTQAVVSVNANNRMRATVSEGALDTNSGGAQLRDTRVGVSEPSVAQVRTELSVTGITLSWAWRIVALRAFTIKDENSLAVLVPGSGWTVATEATNQEMFAAFFWRERTAIESELNF